jgi:hypothetical protein
MEIGTFTQFFATSFYQFGHLAMISFFIQIWQETEPYDVFLRPADNVTWLPKPLGFHVFP